MKKVKHICRSLGWEFVLFLIPLIVMLILTWKVINDFLNTPASGIRFKIYNPQIQNVLLMIALAHGVHVVHKHYKRKRRRAHGKL
jgi:uncharacterized oligopeptide transporter (OPT) family protein